MQVHLLVAQKSATTSHTILEINEERKLRNVTEETVYDSWLNFEAMAKGNQLDHGEQQNWRPDHFERLLCYATFDLVLSVIFTNKETWPFTGGKSELAIAIENLSTIYLV